MIGKHFSGGRVALAGFLGLALGGGLGFGLANRPAPMEQVRIEPAALTAQFENREALLGRALSRDEKQAVLDRIVQQEILVREADRMGLHRKDADMRKHMIALMNHVMFTRVPEPSEAQLSAFYEADPARYMLPESVTFEHVFFGDDKDAAQELANAVRAGAQVPPTAGQKFWLGRRMEGYFHSQLLTVMGHDFTRALKSHPVGEWVGPIRSGRGWHLVRVESFQPPAPLPTQERNRRLQEDWKKDYLAREHDNKIAAMTGLF